MLTLHGYWRSSAAWRVRLALNLKGIGYHQVTHDLRDGEQSAPDYLALNRQGLVPALDIGGEILTQSPAILEWIDETWPRPALLPGDARDRAIVRAMMAIIACDIHPINNLRVLNTLKDELDASQKQVDAWITRWITSGFDALEVLIARHGSTYAFGDTLTLADCCLVPQVFNARRFNIDLSPWPHIVAVDAACAIIPAVIAAQPSQQPDAA